MSSKLRNLSVFIVAAVASAPAHAIQFDGFFTVGAATQDDKNKNTYISSLGDRGVTEDITFETDTRFGLQMTSDVSEDMTVVAQLLATGTNGNFDAVIEWGYVDYEFADWLSVRAGKIKQPVYLVNDYVEVGYAYPWIRPPVEVYYLNNPLNTVNGMELLLSIPLGPGRLSFQPYIGSNRDDIPNTGGAAYFEAENIYGIDVKYAGRGYTVHASNFTCDVKTTGNLVDVPTRFGFPVDVNLNGEGQCRVSAAGLNLDIADVVFYGEWQKRTTKSELSRPFGDQDAWYTTIGYRMGKWLPHITFAAIDGESSQWYPPAVSCAASTGASGCPAAGANAGDLLFNFPISIQTSITAGLRYEVNDSAALKVEYSVVDVENDPSKINEAHNPFGLNYGLFNSDFTKMPPSEKVGVTSIALDVIF